MGAFLIFILVIIAIILSIGGYFLVKNVDCQVSSWGDWDKCSVKCGGGIQTRTRKVIKYPKNNGKMCPNLTETRECNNQECPINCQMSDWGEWGKCSEDCGGGIQTRTRHFEGDECSNLTETQTQETRECNTQECPINCQLSDWEEWSECSEMCGGGIQTRTRNVITNPQFGGEECANLTETRECNTQECPINCQLSDWGEWSKCSETCGGGTQTRTRNVITNPQFGGKECANLTETQECNTQVCSIDCLVSNWGIWSDCSSAGYGGGIQTRTRNIVFAKQGEGKECPPLIETKGCNLPVDCQVSNWGDWSECSSPCNDGTQTRSRSVIVPATLGGIECPNVVETRTCRNECQLFSEIPYTEDVRILSLSGKCLIYTPLGIVKYSNTDCSKFRIRKFIKATLGGTTTYYGLSVFSGLSVPLAISQNYLASSNYVSCANDINNFCYFNILQTSPTSFAIQSRNNAYFLTTRENVDNYASFIQNIDKNNADDIFQFIK